MKCQCGSSEEIMLHGHYQCSKCGRQNDGDCCQGIPLCVTDDKEKKKAKIDTNYEAVDY